MSLISALRRQTGGSLFKASLDYRAGSMTGSKAIEKPCLENQREGKKLTL